MRRTFQVSAAFAVDRLTLAVVVDDDEAPSIILTTEPDDTQLLGPVDVHLTPVRVLAIANVLAGATSAFLRTLPKDDLKAERAFIASMRRFRWMQQHGALAPERDTAFVTPDCVDAESAVLTLSLDVGAVMLPLRFVGVREAVDVCLTLFAVVMALASGSYEGMEPYEESEL